MPEYGGPRAEGRSSSTLIGQLRHVSAAQLRCICAEESYSYYHLRVVPCEKALLGLSGHNLAAVASHGGISLICTNVTQGCTSSLYKNSAKTVDARSGPQLRMHSHFQLRPRSRAVKLSQCC